jgi:hypothetical protein
MGKNKEGELLMLSIQTLKKMQEYQGLLCYLMNTQSDAGAYIDDSTFEYVKAAGLKDVIAKTLLTKPIEMWKDPETHRFLSHLSYELESVPDEMTMKELAMQ